MDGRTETSRKIRENTENTGPDIPPAAVYIILNAGSTLPDG
jgi:hypothetical protein